MIDLAVFDWNGTLLSDTAACLHADNVVIPAFGGRKVSLNEYRNSVNIPAIEFYVKQGCSRQSLEKEKNRVNRLFIETYETRAAKCRLRKGARKLLHDLKAMEVRTVILSNHTRIGIDVQLSRLGMKHLIDEVLANPGPGQAFLARKKKERIKNYLKSNQFSKAAIIGDSPEEVEIGRELGMATIAVSDGYYAVGRLRKSGPDFLTGHLGKIFPYLKSI